VHTPAVPRPGLPAVTELHTTQVPESPGAPAVTELHTSQVPESPGAPAVTELHTTQVPGVPNLLGVELGNRRVRRATQPSGSVHRGQ